MNATWPLDERFPSDERFEHRAFLGRGSSGSVFRVYDRQLGAEVALKAIHAHAAEEIYRLKQEFRALAGIVHPNLIQLHDLVVREGACFFTMTYVDGCDFVEYVRGDLEGPLDAGGLGRFFEAAPQLVRGLAALHAAGRVHRDLKPSNVLVRRDGLVVVLDFDLAVPLTGVGVQQRAEGEFAGTLAYMAPEQLRLERLGPAADWWALGVVLHEALTGLHPLRDWPPAQLLRTRSPLELDFWDPALPQALHGLVLGLLAADARDRPDAARILAALGAGEASRAQSRPRLLSDPAARFVGRDAELAALRSLCGERGARIAAIRGPSGIGKSELARQFLLEAEREALVLAGRCHPQEAVPFKALDPLIDAVSLHLLERAHGSEPSLPPLEEPAAATRLFPVLARAPGFEARPADAELDVAEARRRGIGALRELLRGLAAQQPLVLWIDDAQWSDRDSADLLAEILSVPEPPQLLLILTYRSETDEAIPLVESLRALGGELSSVAFREIPLAPLAEAEARVLARSIWPGELPPEQLESLVGETRGSPFLLNEVAWHLRDPATQEPRSVDLGEVIAGRLHGLTDEERVLLELAALAGRPTESALLLEAAGVGPRGQPLLGALEGLGLIRSSPFAAEAGAPPTEARRVNRIVEPYHDRIQETITRNLGDPHRTAHHAKLARSFEASGRVPPERLAHHFHGARELQTAARYAVAAADRASEALAFGQAAELYRHAREWDPQDAERTRALMTKEADALGNAAQLVQSGRLFLRAAEDAPRLEALELRRRAAEHLAGGEIGEGLGVMETLLHDLGMRFPSTPQRALAGALARLVGIVLRGFTGIAPGADELDPVARIRIDLCYGIGVRLVDADAVRGIYFSVRSLELALAAGDPVRIARSLSAVGGSISVIGFGPLARIGKRMTREAEAIARREARPELDGTIDVGLAQVLMLTGRSREALERGDRGVATLSERCRGYAFECNFGRANSLRALEELGRLDDVERRAQELRDAAAAVGNPYAETAGCQYLAIARIARGDVEAARELAHRGLELWTRRDFHIQHLYAARIQALCDLYEARNDDGARRLAEIRPALERSGLLRIALVRTDVASLDGQLALARAAETQAPSEARLAARRRCEAAVARLERESRSDAAVHVQLLRAGLASLRGAEAEVVEHLDAAMRQAEDADFDLRALCARLRRAQLASDTAALTRVRDAMHQRGVREPDRWVALYAPGRYPAAASRV